MRPFVIFSVCLLSACGASLPVSPENDRSGIDRTVRNAAGENGVVKESVLRDEGKVSLALHLPESWKERGDLHLQVDCSGRSADWLYADIVDKKSPFGKKTRRYGNGTASYSSPITLGESATEAVFDLPEVKRACERNPSWREVSFNKKSDTQILLEVSSLQAQADGSVRFWAALDYPWVAYIRLFNAPYARRAGFYQANCHEQTYSLLYVYYLDQQHTVTDSGMPARPPVLDIEQATGDSASLMSVICGQENLASALLPVEPRSKFAPDYSVLAEPDTGIAAQLRQLKRTPSRQSLSALRFEGTRASMGGSAAARFSKAGFFQQDVSIETTSIPGMFRVARQEGGDRTEELSFLGMIPVSQTRSNAEEQHFFTVTKLELRGDWDKMPIGSQLGYWRRMRVVDLVTNQGVNEAEVICKVIRDVQADSLNPQLHGNARELKCHTVGDRNDELATYYYLEDYGYAFFQGSTSTRYVVNGRIAEIVN